MRRPPTIRYAVVALAIGACCACRDVAAAEKASGTASVSHKDEAREAYRLGTVLARGGQWRDALAAFRRSATLFAHPATSFNVAYCERALGHHTRARKYFRLALAQHATSGALAATRAAQAKHYLLELAQNIARLRVTISAGAQISVDAAPLSGKGTSYVAGVEEGGRATRIDAPELDLALDPGTHVLVAEGREGQRVELRLRVRPGERRAVSLVFPPSEPREDHLGPWSLAVMATGASGLVAGAAFGIAALEKREVLDERCPEPTRCPIEHEGDIATLGRAARASTVALSVGGIISALGIALFVYDRVTRGEPTTGVEESRVRLTPSGVGIGF